MPGRKQVYNKIKEIKNGQDQIRHKYLGKLHEYRENDIIVLASAFSNYKAKGINVPSGFFSISKEDISGFMSALKGLDNDTLDLVLHSPGGSGEAAVQIVEYIRDKYDTINAIVPQNAMSAATMIACACDKIIMGRHSALGPIDPQMLVSEDGKTFSASACAILEEIKNIKEEVIENPDTAPFWFKRLDKYDIGIIKKCNDAIDFSKERVEEWLKKYMFNNNPNAAQKAKSVSKWLSKKGNHNSHGRPLNYQTLRSKDFDVELLEDDQRFQKIVLSLFHSILATFDMGNCMKFIENHNEKGVYLNFDPSNK